MSAMHGTGAACRTGAASRMAVARRGWAVGVLGLALAPLLAGCGIRTTSVPVDAGPAPSRVSCAQPAAPATPLPDAVTRKVYLVCSGQIAPVRRPVRVADVGGGRGGRERLARQLIALLQASPRAAESTAGFYTAVPVTLEVLAPLPGDPADALRLSEAAEDLPSFVLGQVVCTLAADSALAPGGSVVLGGPDAGDELRRYSCTPELRTSADAAVSAGEPVP
ncbi:hypothetical protein V2S66_06810 [Streptomyces sp. V4-01]|uniref:GerMN domain-containing protein n=1 Tax=Actinacidiphila polyblastidii TaxID=3110430 RepID=A0ABU7P792_9ACTN|nr:hypothetical protein [Streptomyces sp. V4-01]